MSLEFKETQKFMVAWKWFPLLLFVGIESIHFLVVYTCNKMHYRTPHIFTGNIVSAVAILIVYILFYFFRLETRIDQTGIFYKFYPVHQIENKLDWDLVARIYVRQYKPLREYGGWGFRGFGKNRALNVSGNMGIQIELKNGKKLLLGTQKPEEADAVLAQLSSKGIVNNAAGQDLF